MTEPERGRTLLERVRSSWRWCWRPGPLRCGYPRLVGCREVTGGGRCPRHQSWIEQYGRAMSTMFDAMRPRCLCGHGRSQHSSSLIDAPCLECGCPMWIDAETSSNSGDR